MICRTDSRLPLGAVAIILLVFFAASPARAHVGSPDVFYEGDAGAYHLFVTVIVPQVIPGVAEVQVRAPDDVRQISTSVARLTGAGSKYAPVPDIATRSSADPRLFTSSIWLMEYGSLQVELKVSGDRGTAELSVPVPSYARKTLAMPPWLGAILLVLTTGLAIGAISIIGAAAREARLSPGAIVDGKRRRSGRIAMAVSAAVVAAIFYLAFAWWNSDAIQFARTTKLFKPPPLSLTLVQGDRLRLKAADSEWARYGVMNKLLPDHDHLMHAFLIRTPGFDRFWHLHPDRQADGSFETPLPPLDAGRYQVFADVVDESGFPWTLVGAIDLPQIKGSPLSPDDSGGSFPPLDASKQEDVDVLPDGTRVVWQHDPLRANVPMILRFKVQNPDGSPATDLEPYMGMAAHLEIVRSDLSVFAHIHPSGSVPMAAMMLASNDKSEGGQTMTMPDGMKMAMPEKIGPELSMPYGFPKPGSYRVFIQFKRGGKIETADFDAQVD